MLCADIVDISWKDAAGRAHRATALLEDIAPQGACLQVEKALPLETEITIEHPKIRMRGAVRYCAYRDIGYFLGLQFTAGSQWSKNKFTPQHLLDLEDLVMRGVNKASRRRRPN